MFSKTATHTKKTDIITIMLNDKKTLRTRTNNSTTSMMYAQVGMIMGYRSTPKIYSYTSGPCLLIAKITRT